ncbi:MAG: twin-arginine translocase TatA/TatE family subunit [Legionellaceae bacterium]|nr:twin-arginine translocase TatA/TatE family subunit [Legionellaceae bacterium]
MGLSNASPVSLLLIFLMIIFIFGTEKLKHIGHDLGEALKNFRRALQDSDTESKS